MELQEVPEHAILGRSWRSTGTQPPSLAVPAEGDLGAIGAPKCGLQPVEHARADPPLRRLESMDGDGSGDERFPSVQKVRRPQYRMGDPLGNRPRVDRRVRIRWFQAR